MASPQLENGFTRIANELMEAFANTNLTQYEYKALFLIVRNIYGYQGRKCWQLKKWCIFEQAGIGASNIRRILFDLTYRDIIDVNWKEKTIYINKDYEKWLTTIPKEIRELTSYGDISKIISLYNYIHEEVIPRYKLDVIPPYNKKLYHHISEVISPYKSESCNSNDSKGLPAPKTSIKKENNIYKERDNTNSKADEVDAISSTITDEFSEKRKRVEQIVSKYFTMSNLKFRPNDITIIAQYSDEQINNVVSRADSEQVMYTKVPGYVLRGLEHYAEWYDGNGKQQPIPAYHQIVEFTEPPKLDEKTAAIEAECKRIRIDMRANNRSSADILQAMEEYKDAQASK